MQNKAFDPAHNIKVGIENHHAEPAYLYLGSFLNQIFKLHPRMQFGVIVHCIIIIHQTHH